MKKFFAISIALIFYSFQPGFSLLETRVKASENTVSNDLENQIIVQAHQQTGLSSTLLNTGDNATANTTQTDTTNTSVSSDNNAHVNQTVNADANTGYNSASRNISIGGNAGMITTGDATVNTIGVVQANGTNTNVENNPNDRSTDNSLLNTGDSSSFSNSNESNSYALVHNGNTVYVNQSANATANTGNNLADRNISVGGTAGVINTGNASTNTSFLVAANGNVTLVGGENNGNGPGSGASIAIANTGDNSHFNRVNSNSDFISLQNLNNATVNQSCNCQAITGGNSSNRGIAVGGSSGVITTQDATINAYLAANLNRNNTQLYYLPDGSPITNAIFNTGDNVSQQSNTNDNSQTHIQSSNNADLNQTVNAVADTGHNTADRNISIGGDAGIITTGDALINAYMLAELNKNSNNVNEGSAALNSR